MLRNLPALMETGRALAVGFGAIARSWAGVAGCCAAGLAGLALGRLDEGQAELSAQVVMAGGSMLLAAGFLGQELFRARPRPLVLRVREPMSRGTNRGGSL